MNSIKKLTKQIMPATMVDFIKLARYRGFATECRYRLRSHRIKRDFREANANLGAGQIAIRRGMVFAIHPDAREGFEYFAHTDMETWEELEQFMVLSRGRRLLWDVGALHGIFSLAFCRQNQARAVAFEPSPAAIPVLTETIRLNPDLRIAHSRLALGDKVTSLKFSMSGCHACVAPDSATAPFSFDVQVTTMDALSASMDRPDTLKIDVEGFEWNVLCGGWEMLRRDRPLIFLEVHPPLLARLGHSLSEVWALLKESRYEILSAPGRRISLKEVERQGRIRRVICEPQ